MGLLEHLFVPDVSILEKIIRSVIVYLFLLFALRIFSKRQLAQLTPFDLVVLLVISNVLQNAIIGKDDSLGGGLIGAITIFILNFLIAKIAYRSKLARRILEHQPTILIHNGHVLHRNLENEEITLDDLMMALRENGIIDTKKVRSAILEENGQISIIPF